MAIVIVGAAEKQTSYQAIIKTGDGLRVNRLSISMVTIGVDYIQKIHQ